MATWSLSPQHKKSAVEKMFFFNNGKIITIEQGFRWATFKAESNERPLTNEELKNTDGYELASFSDDGYWEMWDMTDGCWLEIESHVDATEADVEAFTAAWEEDSYEGVEALGWSQDECEYYYYGPLELTNEDTGEVFQGEPSEPAMTFEEKVEIVKELEQEVRDEQAQGAKWPFSPPSSMVEEPELTDWFPVKTKPFRKGIYEILTQESINWPFPNKGEWDGKKWNFLDHTVTHWRGLAKDPNE
jgi:hypothetical protein